MRRIDFSIKSDKHDVKNFLDELKTIINHDDFDVENEFVLVISRKEEAKYSTRYTLLDLEYDVEDVIRCLDGLTIENYSETLFDKDDDNPPLLFVFGKYIGNKLVYIKLKMKGAEKRWVLCVSFHYAKWDMFFPYE